MFCNKCGKSLPDSARFCDGCGNAVSAPAYQPASPIRPPVHYTLAPTVLDVDTPSVSALKNLAKSPLVLFLALALTGSLVIGLMNALGAISSYMEVLRTIFRELGETELLNMISSLESGFTTSAVMSYVLPAVFALGVWITFVAGFKKKGMTTAGLTMMKVVNIINMVMFCIVAAVISLVMGLVLLGLNNAEELIAEGAGSIEVISTIVGVAFVVLLAYFAMMIVFYARVIGTINAAKEVAVTGKTRKKASVYAAVLCFVSAASSISSGLSALSAKAAIAEQFAGMEDMPEELLEILQKLDFTGSALPTLLSGAAMLLLGILILSYRSKVQPLAEYVDMPIAMVPVVPVMPVAPVEEPVVEEPVAEPVVEEPVVEESIEEEPAVEEPAAEESIVEETAEEEPVVEEPVAEPAVEESIEEEPVAEEPVAEEPIVIEPIVMEPAILPEPEPQFVFCGGCGQKIIATAKFCPRCGRPR